MAGNNFSSLQKTVRAVIISGEKMLLCREKRGKWYFLPGWKVGRGEKSEETLASYISEKLATAMEEYKYIGATSNFYRLDKFKTHQEFELVYAVKIEGRLDFLENENLEFIWLEIKTIRKEKIYPKLLKEKLVDWFDNQQVFWGSD